MGVILQKWGIDAARITELDWWQSTERNGVKYTALPARHDSSRGCLIITKHYGLVF